MLPITFSLFIAPAFNSKVIDVQCQLIDQLEAKQLKCSFDKQVLLSLMQQSHQANYPEYQKYFNFVKESI